MEKEEYIKSVTRMYSYDTIKEWYIGESVHLRSMLGTGFFETIYISRNGTVEFYYYKKEVELFEKALEEYLDEETFNDLCDEFMRKIKMPEVKIRDIVPHLTVFNEVDEYPEWFEEEYRENCQRRLLRVRQSTESTLYLMMKKSDLKNFVFYKGETYPLEFAEKLLSKTL